LPPKRGSVCGFSVVISEARAGFNRLGRVEDVMRVDENIA
jgi:hypothetical protein